MYHVLDILRCVLDCVDAETSVSTAISCGPLLVINIRVI